MYVHTSAIEDIDEVYTYRHPNQKSEGITVRINTKLYFKLLLLFKNLSCFSW